MRGPQDLICKLFCKQGFHSIALLQPIMSLILSDHFPNNETKFDHVGIRLMIVFGLFHTILTFVTNHKHIEHLPLMSARTALDLLELIRSEMGPCRSCPCVHKSGCYRVAGHSGSGRCFAWRHQSWPELLWVSLRCGSMGPC